MHAPLVLASSSPQRRILLETAGIVPDRIISPRIDETPRRRELPAACALRLGTEKARKVAADFPEAFVLAADTIVACGRRMLPKAVDSRTARICLAGISGRAHRVHTGVCLIPPAGHAITRAVCTRVKVRHLDGAQTEEYLSTSEWNGKAGGYAVQGLFAKHILSISGDWTNVMGLPLYTVSNMLSGAGLRMRPARN